jgi:formylglycine-generating enzyme required for sulfatase activity
MRLTENPEVKPKRLVEYLSHRAGWLLPRGIGVYTLPHRTFQEYLAACHLTSDPEFADTMARLVRIEPNRWREVTLLAAARTKRGALASVWDLTQALCEQEVDSPDATLQDAWDALLAAQALVETAELGPSGKRFEVVKERVRGWLKSILEGRDLPAPERAEAGRVLARLGDPRAGVTSVEAMEFCRVPPGPFWMGQGKEAHLNDGLGFGFWIGRYPVSNAQFKNFVEAGGCREPRFWTEAAQDRVWKPSGEVPGRRDDTARSGPRDSGFPYTLESHPVVGITWYEALAFTRWLTEHLHREERLPEGFEVRLPSEPEWEKAARGGVNLPAGHVIGPLSGEVSRGLARNPGPQLQFPWIGGADPERANYAATNVGSTTAVGCFPLGASPYGCQDIAGNVWEWTRSLWGRSWDRPDFGYPYASSDCREDFAAGRDRLRVLRGGAFLDGESHLRCAYRYRSSPDDRNRYFGFRVVVSQSTSGL